MNFTLVHTESLSDHYHIRKMVTGPRLYGGIDTPMLCGIFRKDWRDSLVPMTENSLSTCCQDCAAELNRLDKLTEAT